MPVATWLADGLLVVLQWLHAVAAVAFLGWILVLLMSDLPRNAAVVGQRFKEVADVTLVVFLATGMILGFDRLSNGAGTVYALVLGAKILLSVIAYQYAFRWRRTGLVTVSLDGRVALAAGLGVMLLAAVLKGIFESGLRGQP